MIEKPYVLRVAELIYFKIIEIKKQNSEINNLQAFEIFMSTKEYDFISSGEFHDKWFSELKKMSVRIPHSKSPKSNNKLRIFTEKEKEN